ncbi:MAG TPA: SulP family inorganic anion transporter [Chitinophagaceae bacterium]|nr:SulP family inorganic anion transporter [Chitinophagaceae bacterium]
MKKSSLKIATNLSSSIVVFLVALPLCLGVALASSAPLFSGVIAGVVGGIVVGLCSGSHISVSGPAAGLTVIVATAIGKLQVFEAFLLAVFIAGIIQIILGYCKAGILGDYIPSSVIKGMLAAIGLILILKQFPHIIGYDADFAGDETFDQPDHENTFSEMFKAIHYVTPSAIVIGILSLSIQILWDKVLVKKSKIFKLIPAPLVVVLTGIGISQYCLHNMPTYALQADQMVSIPQAKTTQDFLSFFTLPKWSFLSNYQVWITAITIAIVASLESLLSIEAADELDPYKRVTPTNRELKAQGIGNLISGLIGGLPVTSVIVRTSANVNAGATNKLSTILHGLLILLSVAFIPHLLNFIPLSCLAAILIYTGFKLAKPSIFKVMYKKGWDQFMPFAITIVAIVFTDLLKGILVGIIVGLFFVLRSNFRTAVFIVNDDDKYLFRLRKDVSFLNKPIIKQKLEQVPENASVLIDASRADFIDKDVIEVIEDFLLHAHLKNITVEIKKSMYKNYDVFERFETANNTNKQLV